MVDARPERFELPTTWFEARYSIQLSYGRESAILARCSPDVRLADAGIGSAAGTCDDEDVASNHGDSLETDVLGLLLQFADDAHGGERRAFGVIGQCASSNFEHESAKVAARLNPVDILDHVRIGN